MHEINNFDIDDFLQNYWQKKPLLIRDAFPGIKSPLTAEELAGLSCEENVNARLVLEKDGDYPWQAEFGPLQEERFSELPESHWSLLVSDVERLIPETGYLVKPFRFLPDWRLDDLMISYAPQGGSVGPHIDDYDVFLIQLNGQRLWKISEHFVNDTIEDVDLRILKQFEAEQEWLCNPGDLLYLPPNVAHHGIGQGVEPGESEDPHKHCMTASVGFRAPSIKTMTSDYVNFLNENTHDTTRFTDSSTAIPEHHAEISDETITQFVDYLQQGLTLDHDLVKRWLGQYRSDNKAFEDSAREIAEYQNKINLKQLLSILEQATLEQSPYSNFLFSHLKQNSLLFVDGCTYETSKKFAEIICDEQQINSEALLSIMNDRDKEVLLALFNNGSILASDD